MGIRSITRLIQRYCPEQVKESSLSAFKGKPVAIDGNLLMQKFHHGSELQNLVAWYRFLRSLRERHDITPICIFDGSNRLPQKHKELVKRQASRMLLNQRAKFEQERSDRVDAVATKLSQLNALPLATRQQVIEHLESFVKPEQEISTVEVPAEAVSVVSNLEELLTLSRKATEISQTPVQQRLTKLESDVYASAFNSHSPETEQEEMHAVLERLQLDAAGLSEKYIRRSTAIPQGDYDKLELLIKAMGIPFMKPSDETPHEAEALGATLVTAGLAEVVITEDSDVLLYDASMLRNVTGFKLQPSLVNGRNVREAMDFDREQFIDMCLLCGSDFAPTIPQLGPISAYKLIKEHGSIEAIIQHDKSSVKPKFITPDFDLDNYLQQILLAREVYQGPPCIPSDAASLQMKPESADLEKLIEQFGLQDEYIADGFVTSKSDFFGDRPTSSTSGTFEDVRQLA